MYDPEDQDVFRTCACIVIGGLLLLFVVFSCIGCSTIKECPECVPEIKIVEVKVPVLSCPDVPEIPPLVLPSYPELPPDASEGSIKDWYAEMSTTVKLREAILTERILLLRKILSEIPK